jgi:DNA-directed RNA polymerase sigma subunit (sigma70/sigma32)
MNENEAMEKSRRIDLGLAILAATSKPGTEHTCEEIAAYCGCTAQNVHHIEQKALAKLRLRLRKLNLTPEIVLSSAR